jgi:chromatin structure-remodeling complex subunit RSC1/2
MAFSNLKASLLNRDWKDIKAFVRDCALIWHNAHTYNRPDAGAYQDASTMKQLMEEQFQRLIQEGKFTAEDAEWPDLGEIPPVEDLPEDEDDEDDDDEDDDDEEGDESGDEARVGRGKRTRRSSATTARGLIDGPKRRGRPPKVDTPMEARIKNILKGLRRIKDREGSPKIHQFERLPDKSVMPEYYVEIQHPTSIEIIKVCYLGMFFFPHFC